MFIVVRSNDSFNFPLGWIKYIVTVAIVRRSQQGLSCIKGFHAYNTCQTVLSPRPTQRDMFLNYTLAIEICFFLSPPPPPPPPSLKKKKSLSLLFTVTNIHNYSIEHAPVRTPVPAKANSHIHIYMYSLCIRNIHDKPYGFCGCKAICLLYLLMQYTKRYMIARQTDR